uniref:Omega-x desaturase 2 n=1 Tax=Hediste diversicolor TaxID=126592 RepID=A0A411KYF4_HEDDI|nr:Omega-x desaturase 2 [Hediste diversicolor]
MAVFQTQTVGSHQNGTMNGQSNSNNKQNGGKPWVSDLNDPDIRNAVPQDVPSIIDLKTSLPKHCFEGNLSRSMFYVFKDLSIAFFLYFGMLLVDYQPYSFVKFVYTPFYWFMQGTIFWAIFVLGHDCGHGSFSKFPVINDVMGTFLHTMILVPFYPWKVSHRHHHKNTNNIDREEVFYPIRAEYCKEGQDFRPFKPVFLGGISWFAYLVVGYFPRNNCHFNPFDSLYYPNFWGCFSSLAVYAGWLWVVYGYGDIVGLYYLASHYLIPVLIFATWLVMVTFLHHNEVSTPWYADDQWDMVRGQLSSVDRDYGWAHGLTHNIGTHQIHHLFTKIPHYMLEEATAVFRQKYPHLVRQCDKPIIPSFFRMFDIFEDQRHIKDDTKLFIYKSINKEKTN